MAAATFAELVGQEHVVRALTNALDAAAAASRVPVHRHARRRQDDARAHPREEPQLRDAASRATPCGECAPCRDIDAGRFVDLLELDAASNTGVDNMREILDNARYAPTRGRYKVYLIDEVHMLSKARVQLDAEDARGAAGARQVRARHDRSAEDAGRRCCRAACSST